MTPDGDGRGAGGRGDDEFALRIDERDGSVFVAARGDVDVESVTAFNDGLREAVSRTPPEVRVDLTGITFLGSEGIRTLVLVARCRRRPGYAPHGDRRIPDRTARPDAHRVRLALWWLTAGLRRPARPPGSARRPRRDDAGA